MRRVALVLALPLLLPPGSARRAAAEAESPSRVACAPAPDRDPGAGNGAAERLGTLLEAARADDFDAILRELRATWATDGDRKDDLDAAIVNVGQWSVLSDGLAPEGLCVEGDSVAVGEYRNDLTGAVDRLRLAVRQGPGGGITEAKVTYAVRLAEPVPSAASDAERVRVLDDFVSRLTANDVFSGVVLVAHHGRPIYTRAFGQERGQPIREDTQFNLASMNKMFTAVSILRLVEKGDLSLDDSLGDLLPEEFGEGEAARVRVEHLLSHTSGFSMYGPTFVFSPPGSSFSYANFGFLVLGKIIEATTQMRFEDYVQLEIFGPLGMANTARYDLKELSPYVTWGYYYPIPAVDDRLERIPNKYLHIYTGGPMGGMYSTVGDLLRFAVALREGRLVSPETLELMKTPKPELGAPEYGFGIMLWQAPGVWGHSGRLPGADADLEFYDDDYIGIVLANYDNVNLPVLRTMRALFHRR